MPGQIAYCFAFSGEPVYHWNDQIKVSGSCNLMSHSSASEHKPCRYIIPPRELFPLHLMTCIIFSFIY